MLLKAKNVDFSFVRIIIKRAVFAAAICFLFLMSACTSAADDVTVSDTYGGFFRAERNVITSRADGDISGFTYIGERMYYILCENSADGSSTYTLSSVDLNGDDMRSQIICSGNNVWLSQPAADSDGNLVFVQISANYSEDSFTLLKFAQDGTQILSSDISDEVSQYSFFADDIITDMQGRIYVSSYFELFIFDTDGALLDVISLDDHHIQQMVRSEEGNILLWLNSSTDGLGLFSVDTESSTFGEKLPIKISEESYNYYSIIFFDGGHGYDLLFTDMQGLYAVNLSDNSISLLLDGVSSDVTFLEAERIFPNQDGGFICIGKSYLDGDPVITRILPSSESLLTGREELILAMPEDYMYNLLDYSIVMFNMQSTDYRINIKKYSSENYPDNLNSDIAAGKIPDILVGDERTPFEIYAGKGVLSDLYSFLDSDDEFSRSDFPATILSAFDTDGALYSFTDSFMIYTVLGKTSIFSSEAGSLTIERLDEISAAIDGNTEIFAGTSKSNILEYAMMMSADEFIDYKNSTCNFTSDYFISLLEFADKFPEAIDDSYFDDIFSRYYTMYANEEALLMAALLTDYADIYALEHSNFGSDVTAVGFPSVNSSGSILKTDSFFAISSQKKYCAEGAWQFLRTLFSSDYQAAVSDFPVLETELEKRRTQAMEYEQFRIVAPITQMGDVMLSSGDEYDDALTVEDVSKINDLIYSELLPMRYNTTVNDIVNEEAAAYFSGTQSAEATAALIQSRVSLYLSEQK